MGVPDTAYSFGRFLEVLLADRYPEHRFEIINAAMTAINSHVVRDIATDCIALEPDVYVVYLGNNEVIGPFGPASGSAPPMWAIRLGLWVKTTHLGQWMAGLAEQLGPDEKAGRWKGMALFTQHAIAATDPRLLRVREHLARNLDDICSAANAAEAKTILCTVAVNLRDCPPFASGHRDGLGVEDLAAWEEHVQRGRLAQQEGRFEDALAHYERAAAIDDRHAELRFRMARCLERTDRQDLAEEHYRSARNLDRYRFRADDEMNDIIRKAADRPDVALVDADRHFADLAISGGTLSDRRLFWEHVHPTYEGNYELARMMLPAIEEALSGRLHRSSSPDSAVPNFQTCAERLAITRWDRHRVLREELWDIVARPPFTQQVDHDVRLGRLMDRRRELTESLTPARLLEAVGMYERATARAPGDPFLKRQFGLLLFHRGDVESAILQWRRARELLPNDSMTAALLAQALLARQDRSEALDLLDSLQDMTHHSAESYEFLVEAFTNIGDLDAAEQHAREGIERHPDDYALRCYLGQTLFKKGDRAEAKRAFEQTLEAAPGYTIARSNLGALLLAQGRTAGAIRQLTQAVRDDPYLAEARYNLGSALAADGRRAEARKQLGFAVRLEPENMQCRLQYADILAATNEAGLAIETYEQILKLRPGWRPALRNLAWLLATYPDEVHRRPAESLRLAHELVRLTGGGPRSLAVLGAALAANSDFTEALDVLDQAAMAAQRVADPSLAKQIQLLRTLAKQRRGPHEHHTHP